MAKSVIGKLLREQRKRDQLDPYVLYVGGTTSKPLRYCYGCGPKYLDVAAGVRASEIATSGVPNGPCDDCGELLLRP